jgi:hypothetical protein
MKIENFRENFKGATIAEIALLKAEAKGLKTLLSALITHLEPNLHDELMKIYNSGVAEEYAKILTRLPNPEDDPLSDWLREQI